MDKWRVACSSVQRVWPIIYLSIGLVCSQIIWARAGRPAGRGLCGARKKLGYAYTYYAYMHMCYAYMCMCMCMYMY